MNFLYAEVNFVGAMVLLLMITNWNRSSFNKLPLDQKIFNGVMFFNLLIFVFDTGMWLADGDPRPWMRHVMYASTILYYIFNPLICLLWVMYADFKIYESKYGLLRRMRFYVIPAIISTILSLATIKTQYYFIIDVNNHYIRGEGFPVMSILALIYLVYAVWMSLDDIRRNGWGASQEVNMTLLIFPFIVIASVLIQIWYFGLSIIWVCTMLACTSVYIKTQNAQISTDYLTGVYNRRRLDQHLRRRIRMRRQNRLLFAAIIDVDAFKSINDTYGHVEGDRALVKVSEILRKTSKRSEAFVARLGGDEFIIVGERNHQDEIALFMERLQMNVVKYNQEHPAPYVLTLSMGHAVFQEGDTIDSFLAAADQAMYREKQAHKAEGRLSGIQTGSL
nr:GGDEF domain-containing protein [Fusibacter paucivorans]